MLRSGRNDPRGMLCAHFSLNAASPAANSSFTAYDGTSLQCQTTGTVTVLQLSSAPRPVQMQVLAAPPAGVELNGVSMAGLTSYATLRLYVRR